MHLPVDCVEFYADFANASAVISCRERSASPFQIIRAHLGKEYSSGTDMPAVTTNAELYQMRRDLFRSIGGGTVADAGADGRSHAREHRPFAPSRRRLYSNDSGVC